MGIFYLLRAAREKYHPLHHIRKLGAFRMLLWVCDVPVWARLYGIRWRVRLRLVRNVSYLLSPRSVEPEIAALLLSIQRLFVPKVFWDVGAHIGYYSWLLRSQDDDLQIALFEPDPVNIALIRQTIHRSSLDGFTVFPFAVSDREGETGFALDTISGATGALADSNELFVKRHYHVNPQIVRVKTVTLDGMRPKGQRVDLIKVDVEGHEAHVIGGGERLLAEDQPILVFESFNHPEDLMSHLQIEGYHIFDAERMTESSACTTNFLALPAHHYSLAHELFTVWKREYQAWMT